MGVGADWRTLGPATEGSTARKWRQQALMNATGVTMTTLITGGRGKVGQAIIKASIPLASPSAPPAPSPTS